MPIDSDLSEFLQTAAADPAVVSELLKRHDSRSPFLFPVYHEGKVSGLLDVRFAECEAIPAKERSKLPGHGRVVRRSDRPRGQGGMEAGPGS